MRVRIPLHLLALAATTVAGAQAPKVAARDYGKSGWFYVSERATPAMRAAALRERPDPKQPGRWEPDPDLRAAARKKQAERLKATFAKLAAEPASTTTMAARLRSAYETAHQQDISRGRQVDTSEAESAIFRPLLVASLRRMPADLPLERPALFSFPALPGARALPNGAEVLRLIQAMQTDLVRSAPSFGPRMSTSRSIWDQTWGRLTPEHQSVGLQLVVEHTPERVSGRVLTWDSRGQQGFNVAIIEPLSAAPLPTEVAEARFEATWSESSRWLAEWIRYGVLAGPLGSYRASPPSLPASEVTLDRLQARVTDLFSGLERALGKPIFAALNDASLLSLLGPNAVRTPPSRLLADLTREGQLEWVRVDGGWVVRPLDPDGLTRRSLDRPAATAFLDASRTGNDWRSAPYLRWVGSFGEREMRSPAAYALLHLLAATGTPVNEPVQLGRDRAPVVVFAAVQPEADRGKEGTWEKLAVHIGPSLRDELRRAAVRTGAVRSAEGGSVPIALVVNDLNRARLEAVSKPQTRLRVVQPGQAWTQDEVGTVATLENYAELVATRVRLGKITREAAQTGLLAVEESLVGTLTVHWPNGAKMVWTLPLDRRETARAEFADLPEAVRNAVTRALGGP